MTLTEPKGASNKGPHNNKDEAPAVGSPANGNAGTTVTPAETTGDLVAPS